MKRVIGVLAIVAIAAAGAATAGQVGRDAVPALDRLPDWAGGRPDVSACERYAMKGLAAPATYRRSSAIRVDSAVLDQAAFDREAGIATGAPRRERQVRDDLDRALASQEKVDAMMAELDRDRAAGHDLRLRRVALQYDADNAAGVPLRASAICMFRLIDGALDDPAQLERRADAAGDANINVALHYLGRAPRRRETATPCCL